jgi:F0F1-type ATP synthase assembly protein I
MNQNEPASRSAGRASNAAWAAFGYVLSGPAVYGGLGWFLDRWLGVSFLLPVGLILGAVLSLYLVITKYGRRS